MYAALRGRRVRQSGNCPSSQAVAEGEPAMDPSSERRSETASRSTLPANASRENTAVVRVSKSWRAGRMLSFLSRSTL